MKYVAALTLFASPALAHPGAHLHPHGFEGWIIGLVAIATVGAVSVVAKARK